MTAVAVWDHIPSKDELLHARLEAGWLPTPSDTTTGGRVEGHASCIPTTLRDRLAHDAETMEATLLALAESLQCIDEEFEQLSHAEQVFIAIWELEAEVNNGGFDLYFLNSAGDNAAFAVHALEEIGAFATAMVLKEAFRQYPDSKPPRDRSERMRLHPEVIPESWERLDEKFFAHPDNLTLLLHRYVTKHKTELRGAAEAGF